MKILLSLSLEQQIRTQAERAYPCECCGILAGTKEESFYRISEIIPVTNPFKKEHATHRYRVDPGEQLRVERDLEKRGHTLLGFYHSHPDSNARPSRYDLDHAWPVYLYLIVSVHQGKSAELTAWILRDPVMRNSAFDEIAIL